MFLARDQRKIIPHFRQIVRPHRVDIVVFHYNHLFRSLFVGLAVTLVSNGDDTTRKLKGCIRVWNGWYDNLVVRQVIVVNQQMFEIVSHIHLDEEHVAYVSLEVFSNFLIYDAFTFIESVERIGQTSLNGSFFVSVKVYQVNLFVKLNFFEFLIQLVEGGDSVFAI